MGFKGWKFIVRIILLTLRNSGERLQVREKIMS